MLYWSLKITVMSILFIFLVHYLIDFFKSTLTVPKVKDLVNAPSQKYEDMYKIIEQKNNDSYTEIDLLPKINVENMKNELKSFLKEQLQNANKNDPNYKNDHFDFTTDISALDSKQTFSSYSEY